MAERQIVVVDVETNGLDPARHVAVEVAWWNLATDEHGVFVPPHLWREVVTEGELEALRINRYLDRLADVAKDAKGKAGNELWHQLSGNTFAGCNPAFDAAFVSNLYGSVYDLDRGGVEDPPQWHHRLLDLSVYAAGVLDIPPTELPGLSSVCERLEVTHEHAHTAFGDVAATVECFRKLFDLQAARGETL